MQWTIGRNSERESKEYMLSVCLDDDCYLVILKIEILLLQINRPLGDVKKNTVIQTFCLFQNIYIPQIKDVDALYKINFQIKVI